MTIIFRQPGTVTWASPDGQQEQRRAVYAGQEITVEDVAYNPAEPEKPVLVVDHAGWTLLIPQALISVIR